MNGKERRLRRILNSDTGRSLVIAVDHGMALGAMTGIVDVGRGAALWDALCASAWLSFSTRTRSRGSGGLRICARNRS